MTAPFRYLLAVFLVAGSLTGVQPSEKRSSFESSTETTTWVLEFSNLDIRHRVLHSGESVEVHGPERAAIAVEDGYKAHLAPPGQAAGFEVSVFPAPSRLGSGTVTVKPLVALRS